MSPILSNTQFGFVVKPTANSAIVKGELLQLVTGSGLAYVALPASDGSRCDFLAIEDAYQDDFATQATGGGGNAGSPYLLNVCPLSGERSIRVLASGTISGGSLVMVQANTGQIKAFSGTGTFSVGVLEEDCVSGQLALVRPLIANY